MKKIFIFSIFLLLSLGLVLAHGEETFAEAEELIKSNTPCDQLTEEQLETIGDYYMEQMHPGEAHEVMDEVMGGEGSESLRDAHINMALSFYCGEHGAMSSGMMDMMMGRGMSMIDYSDEDIIGGDTMAYGMMGTGMMGSFGYGLYGLVYFALAAFIFSVIFWWTHNWMTVEYKKKKRR